DEGRIDLKAQVRTYLPELKRRMIGRYTIEQLLTHRTGLQSELPLDGLLGKQFVANELRDEFTIPVSPDRYLDEDIPATIRKRLKGKIGRTRRLMYRYSDLNYFLLQLAVEAIAEEPMDQLLEREFYRPLQLGKLGFKPAEKYPEQRLVPTVYDQWMRGGLLRGYVHDEGAALLGGVAGHAGLFSNAHNLGQLFQLFLDGGSYAGQQFLTQETIDLFTSRNRYNYRTLGFDRVAGGWPNVVAAGASEQTFGHLGFAGTSVWADPENDLVFVLLTNRVYPDAKNEKFRRMQIRGKVHRDIYRALGSWEKES
ncbi:MAG: serine hydrolase, partial [Bacteroidota bacterium]